MCKTEVVYSSQTLPNFAKDVKFAAQTARARARAEEARTHAAHVHVHVAPRGCALEFSARRPGVAADGAQPAPPDDAPPCRFALGLFWNGAAREVSAAPTTHCLGSTGRIAAANGSILLRRCVSRRQRVEVAWADAEKSGKHFGGRAKGRLRVAFHEHVLESRRDCRWMLPTRTCMHRCACAGRNRRVWLDAHPAGPRLLCVVGLAPARRAAPGLLADGDGLQRSGRIVLWRDLNILYREPCAATSI